MSKYDFGYELEEGSTNLWAFNMVQCDSNVLELGPAIGNLTKHLTEKKNCHVDIVEMDEEAGKEAAQFADYAVLGESGDLNHNVWYKKIQSLKKRYDYIVILDVLEHLSNPEQVLKLVESLLNDSGRVIISVPNLAHNSVMLELYKNCFPYQKLGLLDQTHIHFFTHESLGQMVENSGLYVEVQDAILKTVSDTEFNVSYSEVPETIENALRSRPYGMVYQFLQVLSHQPVDEVINDIENYGIDSKKSNAVVLINGLVENRIDYETKDETVQLSLKLDEKENNKVTCVRFIPVEHDCIVYDLFAYGITKEGEALPWLYNWTSGLELSKGIILLKNGSQINYEQDGCDFKEIRITCKYRIITEENKSIEIAIEKAMEEFSRERDGRGTFTSLILVDGLLKNIIAVQNENGRVKALVNLKGYSKVESIRFIPIEQKCLVRNFKATGIKGSHETSLEYNWSTGVKCKGVLALIDSTQEINIPITKLYDTVQIECECLPLGELGVDMVKAVLNWK